MGGENNSEKRPGGVRDSEPGAVRQDLIFKCCNTSFITVIALL